MTEAWTALPIVPQTVPAPILPDGWTGEPVLSSAGAVRGYLCRKGSGAPRTLAWATNGSLEDWRWMPLAEEQVEQGQPSFPFTLLGHDHGNYFYLGHDTRQVTILRASQHTRLCLGMLAPESFWTKRWPLKKGFDADAAALDLMTAQHEVGIYDPSRVRGRGAWWDGAEALLHLGDRLLVKGEYRGLHEHGQRYIYEHAVPLGLALDNPLSTPEAHKLMQVCTRLSWDKPSHARMLAGWIVCAMICGALRWRPNIWLSGPAGCGKSTVFRHIMGRALGKNCWRFVGGTTEAGLRATLRADAIPVMLDDMDSNSDRGRETMQDILGLLRVFSGEDAGLIAKGSQAGTPTLYQVQSCYAFSSISIEMEKSADKSRVMVLSLRKLQFSEGQVDALHNSIAEAMPDGYSERLFARCVKLIPQIRNNAEIFARAVAKHNGSQRAGDLTGHLLAGCYALHSDGLITMDQAVEWIGGASEITDMIAESKTEVVENNEGARCLWHLCEQQITDSQDGKQFSATVQELIGIVAAGVFPDAEYASMLLKRHGMLVRDAHTLLVANDHTELRRLYRNSQWPGGWAGVLRSLDGAGVVPQTRFGARVSRATSIPLVLLDEAQTAAAPDSQVQATTFPAADAA